MHSKKRIKKHHDRYMGFFFLKEREKKSTSGRLFHCNLKIDTRQQRDACHADFFQLEREASLLAEVALVSRWNRSPRLHFLHATARPSSRQRSD